MLREVAESIKEFIEEDTFLHENANVTVVVEDKADIGFEISNALGQTGVCVLIAVEGFDRIDRSPVLQGNVRFQISCFEHPELNRNDDSVMTAQAVAERLMNILHYHQFPKMTGQMIFKNFSRDDVQEANIVRGNYEANICLEQTETSQEGQQE